ncbi:UNKNOWN [Stylonychia lemnae]|uniref:Rhodanese domain-containing protein n=1 Tax=Stylonychia lemnae TaxID=5949 RepID=A0A078B1L7_STYLE|nr:UNKNOWN [Stylonychia lemnae]|eukprot:CDW87222.1 UNKNOWN [Stylonychia lemnae]
MHQRIEAGGRPNIYCNRCERITLKGHFRLAQKKQSKILIQLVHNQKQVEIPRRNITLQDLMQGFYQDRLPKNKYLIMICDDGMISQRASKFLKRQGFNAKCLLGGIESLDGLIDLQYEKFD